jgi:FkbM family methyltransferase
MTDRSASPSTEHVVPWPDQGMASAFELLRPLALTRPVIIDVGAHNGETLDIAARRLEDGARYLALEPNPATYAILQSRASKYHGTSMHATCVAAAAGPSEGTVTFLATRASAVAGVLPPVAGLGARVPSGDHDIVDEVSVAMVTIDGLMDREGIVRADLLKVDAEGYDLAVLRGTERALREHRIHVVICEVFFVAYREGQAYFWDVATFMHECGYRFVNLFDTRDTSQGRLYTGNGVWVSPDVAAANGYL